MAVFVAGADESSGKGSPFFYWCGFLAPETDWLGFTQSWTDEVLSNPSIPYLHQTDIRSSHWRVKHGVSDSDGQQKLDAAWKLVGEVTSLFPVAVRVDAQHFRDTLKDRIVRPRPGVAPYKMEPDYLCFLYFAEMCLSHVHFHAPDCEKVDFIVERNQRITTHIAEFHDTMRDSYIETGKPHLAKLVGDFIPAGKERVPLQAADMLSWHENRRDSNRGLNAIDRARFKPLAKRPGVRLAVPSEWINGLRDRLARRLNESSGDG